jgi:small subunit ribosomal protein S6
MNRIYETLSIIRPDATDEEINPIIEQMHSVITTAGGTVDKEERWGVRKLAYRVEKRNETRAYLPHRLCRVYRCLERR